MRTSYLRGLLVPLVILLAVGSSHAQRKFSSRTRVFEFGGGPAMVSIQDNDALIQREFKPSFALSAGLVYSLKRNLRFTAQAMYELKGGKAVQRFDDAEVSPALYNTHSSYISFIPGIRSYLGKSAWFIEGGPYVSFLLFSGTRRTVDGYESQWGNPYTSLDAGLSFSIGVTPMRLVQRGFNMRLVNNLGLVDINHHSGTKEYNTSTSLIVGMRIRTR